MTTKAEFDAFIAGLRIGFYGDSKVVHALDEISEKVSSIFDAQSDAPTLSNAEIKVIDDEMVKLWNDHAVNASDLVKEPQAPVVADPGEAGIAMARLIHGEDAQIVQRTRPAVDTDPAQEPAPEPAVAVPEQVEESPASGNPAPAPEVVAGDASQAVTDVSGAPV